MNRNSESCVKFDSFEPTSAVFMKSPRHLLLILPVVLLASCSMSDMLVSTSPHKIKLKDGREVLCSGEPQYQSKTGYYYYRTPDKRDAVIRADDVAGIVEKGA